MAPRDSVPYGRRRVVVILGAAAAAFALVFAAVLLPLRLATGHNDPVITPEQRAQRKAWRKRRASELLQKQAERRKELDAQHAAYRAAVARGGPVESLIVAVKAIEPAELVRMIDEGRKLHDVGKLQLAIAIYSAVIAEDPKNVRALIYRANAYILLPDTSDNSRSMSDTERAYDIDGEAARKHYNEFKVWRSPGKRR